MKKTIALAVLVLTTARILRADANESESRQIAAESQADVGKKEWARKITEAKVWASANGETLPYRIHLPTKPKAGRKYPLVIHLHGAGSRGSDNERQLNTGGADFLAWAKQNRHECVFLAPQCPKGEKWVDTDWHATSHKMSQKPTRYLRMVMEIIEDTMKNAPVDRSRVYVMGISTGGFATWELLQRRPEWFAAALPCCGGGDVTLAQKMKCVAIWAFHGDADPVVPVVRSRAMVEAIRDVGGNVEYREYRGVEHNAWTPTFSDPEVFEWLWRQGGTPRKGVRLSAAMRNVVDVQAVGSAFADYTNNVLRVESAHPAEWDASNPRRIVDRFPASLPYQLVVGSDPADREMAEFARKVIARSMPGHIRSYLCRHKLLAPLEQWLIRRSHPSATNEASYLSAAAHPPVWTAKDFDLVKLEKLASALTSNSVPMLATLQPVYGEFKAAPIRRAEPLVDYPDPRPEEAYATPMGVSIVLRAMESRRKFRFRATGHPFRDANVNFAWVPVNGHAWIGGFPCEDARLRKNLQPDRGFAEITLGWWSSARRDILVFARYGKGPYGPPSVISFYTVPNEQRRYDREGRIESVEYKTDASVIPQLYQNKPWKDSFVQDSLGNLIGFLRTRTGSFKEERFSDAGEFVCEIHPGDLPKTTKKVRYFTRSDDPTTLDYEVTDETVEHKFGSFVPRNRGEFPPPRVRRRR